MWKSEPQGVLPWALSPAVTDQMPCRLLGSWLFSREEPMVR